MRRALGFGISLGIWGEPRGRGSGNAEADRTGAGADATALRCPCASPLRPAPAVPAPSRPVGSSQRSPLRRGRRRLRRKKLLMEEAMVAPTWSGPGAALRGAVLPPVELSLPRGRRDGTGRRGEERRGGAGRGSRAAPGVGWRLGRRHRERGVRKEWGAPGTRSTGHVVLGLPEYGEGREHPWVRRSRARQGCPTAAAAPPPRGSFGQRKGARLSRPCAGRRSGAVCWDGEAAPAGTAELRFCPGVGKLRSHLCWRFSVGRALHPPSKAPGSALWAQL